MNPPPSAKENRQAKKYWLEFEREVIAPQSKGALPKVQKMAYNTLINKPYGMTRPARLPDYGG